MDSDTPILPTFRTASPLQAYTASNASLSSARSHLKVWLPSDYELLLLSTDRCSSRPAPFNLFRVIIYNHCFQIFSAQIWPLFPHSVLSSFSYHSSYFLLPFLSFSRSTQTIYLSSFLFFFIPPPFISFAHLTIFSFPIFFAGAFPFSLLCYKSPSHSSFLYFTSSAFSSFLSLPHLPSFTYFLSHLTPLFPSTPPLPSSPHTPLPIIFFSGPTAQHRHITCTSVMGPDSPRLTCTLSVAYTDTQIQEDGNTSLANTEWEDAEGWETRGSWIRVSSWIWGWDRCTEGVNKLLRKL